MLGEPVERPEHLAKLCDVFDRIEAGEKDIRVLISCPPQHGKSETIGHGIARTIARHVEWPIFYVCCDQKLADSKSRSIRDYARKLGVETRDDADSVGTWLTPANGGIRARGILAGIIGDPGKGAIVDDPHSGRADAESIVKRQRIYEEFTGSVVPRVHPGGFIIVCQARWSEDDLIGRLSKETKADGSLKWEIINLPAVLPNGRPLWHRRPLEYLDGIRRSNENDWQSLWMGQPMARGSRVFKRLTYYDGTLPLRYRVGKGIDLAYTESTHACHSASVVMLEDLDRPENDRLWYVVDVRRMQCEPRDFATELKDVTWQGPWHFFGSVQEVGLAPLMADLGVMIDAERATIDKHARAQPVATAWNEGRILLPRDAPWLEAFANEVTNFTGVKGKDKASDQVDALASAFEGVRYRSGELTTVSGAGSRYGDERGFG